MPRYQGWMRPKGSGRIHYALNGQTLCRRWTVPYPFRRVGLRLSMFVPKPGRVQANVGNICVDCINRHNQLRRNFGLPVEPLEGEPIFGG